MKRIWRKMKEIWWDFWEVDENDNEKKHLSSSDKRWLLYWNFITCMGVAGFFLIITGINNIRITRQNGRDVEDAMRDMLVLFTSILKGGGENDN